MIKKLQAELATAQSKLEAIKKWLIDNTDSPEFCKVASDRNYWTLRIQNTEYKIKQLKQGKPILGYPEELKCEVDIMIKYQTGKINI